MYTIKIYKHSSVRANIDDDIEKIVPYFKSDFVKSIIPSGIDVSVISEKTKIPKQDVYDKLIEPNKGKFNCIMYIFEKGKFPLGQNGYGYALNFAGNTQAIHLMSDIASDNVDYTWKSMCHEILHCITYNLLQKNNVVYDESWNLLDNPIVDGKVVPYYGNENMYLVGGNTYQQLKKISQFFIKKYKYFSDKEIVGLNTELVDKLDKMREECGFPFIINSGFRTQEHNSEVGGVENSEHTIGKGVDIMCKTSEQRYKIIKSAYNNGIDRIGVGSSFVHLGIDKTKPNPVVWLY